MKVGEIGKEQLVEYYDKAYSGEYKYWNWDPIHWMEISFIENYCDFPSYPQILDVGCGVGRFAELLGRMPWKELDYSGFDFSPEAIKQTKERVPGIADYVWVGDAYDRKNYKKFKYNMIVCSEVLEHLDDLRLLENIPKGCPIIGSVPTFGDRAHVRTYDFPDFIDRFSDLIEVKHVEAIERFLSFKNSDYKLKWYVFLAVKK